MDMRDPTVAPRLNDAMQTVQAEMEKLTIPQRDVVNKRLSCIEGMTLIYVKRPRRTGGQG
jgi:hypothetical protein